MSRARPISVVIPSFNGRDLLARHLPSALGLLKQRDELEVLVVDDGSADGTAEWLTRSFPEVKVVALGENRGFARASTAGVLSAAGEIIILLNNDVEVVSDITQGLAALFEDPSLFGVAFDMLLGDTEETYANRILPVWRMGLLSFDLNGKRDGPGPSFYGCGGGMAFDREKYLALGGFDPIFRPYYWEDTDISYRAWKRGFRIDFHPEFRVRHYPSSTINRVADRKRNTVIVAKNRLIFLWKNLTDPGMVLEHLRWLPGHLVSSVRRREPAFFQGFLGAFKSLPGVLRARLREKRHTIKTDRDIFALFSG